MNATSDLETLEFVKHEKAALPVDTKTPGHHQTSINSQDDDFRHPTEEEFAKYKRVSGKIPWQAFTIAFVELCERFSFYGTTAVCKCKIERKADD